MTDTTTITVSDEVWSYLDKRKDRGESFDSLLRDEFDIPYRTDETTHEPPTADGGG